MEAGFDPLEAGLLVPVSAITGAGPGRIPDEDEDESAPARKRSRLSDLHGSFIHTQGDEG